VAAAMAVNARTLVAAWRRVGWCMVCSGLVVG
jgi:hypothetical protein